MEEHMEPSAVLQRFMEKSPIPVMVRALLERVLSWERLDACFAQVAAKQYTRDLLFSTVFELMSLVVFKAFPSIHAAYQAQKVPLGVSLTSVYNKLNGLEIAVPAALVRDTARELGELITQLQGTCEPLLPGYRVKMVDGNCLAATQCRLAVLRDQRVGALPGKSLVIYDPALEMALDVIPCEDGYAQERSLLPELGARVQARDVWIMDRHFCVRSHLFRIDRQGGYFICRYHKQMPCQALGELRPAGTTDTGAVYEQPVAVRSDEGETAQWRGITLRLRRATRDGDKELVMLTNLPPSVASAARISELYRQRWTIETMFQELEAYLQSEIDTLGYPPAALFGFCVALIAYNVLAVVKAALRRRHGEHTIRHEVSGYYLAGEISRTHEGMAIAIAAEEWAVFQTMTPPVFLNTLGQLAQNVQLGKYKKHSRGPKKTAPHPPSSTKGNHVSTARLLLKAKGAP
jgi:hypothetical protein